jgi:outer membrane protein
MEFWVGINSRGVLITPAESVCGDAVNVAARVQNLAAPHGVLVSGIARGQLRGYKDLNFRYLRSDELNNFSGEIRICKLIFPSVKWLLAAGTWLGKVTPMESKRSSFLARSVLGSRRVTKPRNASIMVAVSVVSICLAFVPSLTVVEAADLPTNSASPALPSEFTPHWFVRVGALGAINESSSKLYVQPVVGSFGVGPQLLVPGRGESFSNLFTISVQAGYFFSPNWSLEVAGGFPVWQTTRITGYSATPPFAGTVLSKTVPGSLPITALYHVTQFGPLQPYIGIGAAPVFAFTEHDAFGTGSSTEPSLAFVLQGGFEYMFNQHWGFFLDGKKYFDRSVGKATGLNFGPPLGEVQAAATSVTHAQPWVCSTGLTYRF